MDVGRRVREAREALGLTQKELAAIVGLGRDAIIGIESGERKVKADELLQLARALERSLLFFLQDAQGPDLAVVARRGKAATNDAKRAELWLRRHLDDYRQLLELPGQSRELRVDTAWRASGRIVDQAARAAAAQRRLHGLEGHPITDLREHLEEQVGIPVFGRDVADTDFCGMLLVGGNPPLAAMLANTRLLASRRTFTLAHEYGHLLWKLARREVSDDVFYRDPGDSEEEVFANAFAARLLAPDEEVRNAVTRFGGQLGTEAVAALCAQFHLSFQAMTYRLQGLGLLPQAAADQLRSEVRPSSLPGFRWEHGGFPELSPLYWRLVVAAYESGQLDAGRCGEMLDMTAHEFEDIQREPVAGDALLAAG